MSGTKKSVSASKAPKWVSKRLIVLAALILGVFGALSGNKRYEFKPQVSEESVLEEVLVGCEVIISFPDYLGKTVAKGRRLSANSCARESSYLGNPNAYLKKIYNTETNEKDVVKEVKRRVWSAEIASRGLRFIIGAAIGALFTFGLLSLSTRRNNVLVALNGLKSFVTSSISQIKNPVNTARGSTVMTTDSVQSPPQEGATKNQRRNWFDVRFKEFVTPIIISIFYVFCVVVAFLAGFVFWLATISDFSEEGAVFTALWTAPLIFGAVMIVVLVLRLVFETVMVIFRIADDLKKIRDKLVQ